MKKLMKVLALATAICMLLSVSAFAEDLVANENAGVTADGDATKQFDITIKTGAGVNQEVAVLIVKTGVAPADAEDSDIMYINQVSMVESDVTLENVELLDDVEADVFLGSATLNAATYIGTINTAVVDDGETITIVSGKAVTWTKDALVEAGQKVDVEGGTGVVLNVTTDLDSAIEKILWSFEVSGSERKYSAWIPFAGLEGDNSLEIAAAFSNGNDKVGTIAINDVEAINLIVKTYNGTYVFTDENGDKVNNPDYANRPAAN